ncbi:MAG: hypothetical protein RL616_2320, partial [Verrucomicrobiota bacterium]
LKTFVDANNQLEKTMYWQVVIHMAFVVSAVALACIDKLTYHPVKLEKKAVAND